MDPVSAVVCVNGVCAVNGAALWNYGFAYVFWTGLGIIGTLIMEYCCFGKVMTRPFAE